MSDTLILNATYEPMSVIPLSIIRWQDTMKLMYLDKIKVLHHYDDWVVHSQKTVWRVPSVAITVEYFNFTKHIRYSKANVFLRDLYQCQYCGDTFHPNQLTIDHVIPRAQGGKTEWENVVAACADCNEKKADHTHWTPLRDPYKPDARAMNMKLKDKVFTCKCDTWKEYLEPYRKIA